MTHLCTYRRELYHVQRELLREQTRCKALEEELENPMNIHRWRKLEGSDPSTYEMVQKIHTLQRRLIQKTQEVTTTAIKYHRCNFTCPLGGGKGAAYSRKGEALHGTETNSSKAAWTRGGRAATNLPADSKGEN